MKRHLVYLLIFSGFMAQAMELPLEKENSKQVQEVPKQAQKKSRQKKEAAKQTTLAVTLSYAGESHSVSLSDAHIFTYHIEQDLATQEKKFVGFHHYNLTKTPRKLDKGQVIEINNNLWIYIPEGMDITNFHVGYPIHSGTWYPKKTFFPSNWKRERVLKFIKNQVDKGDVTWHQEGTQKFIGYCPLQTESIALKLVIKCYPPDRHVLLSVFPIEAREVLTADSLHTVIKKTTLSSKKSTLNSLAVEQLRKIQENARLKIQKPELIKAIQTGNHHEVHALLKNDADPNVRDQQGCTPLMIAAQKGDYEIMRDLIDYGALIFENEAYIKDKKGVTVLDYALRSWNEFAVLPLLKQADPNDIELIKIYTKALVTAIDKISSEPVEKLSAEVIHLLLSYGADPTLPDDNGYTPLMHITQLNNLKADALKVAQYIVTLLLERGAKIDAVNEKGRIKNYTALMYAAQSGYTPLVRQLLEAGADYEMLNDQGKNAAVIAENKGQKVTAAAINAYKKEKENWKKNNNATDLIYWAFKNNLPQMKKALTLNPLKINYISENGESALSYAAKNNNYEAVNFLLSNGADPCNRYDQNAGNLDNFISLHTYIQKNSAIAPEIKQVIADYYEQFKRGESAKKLVQEQQKQRIIDQFKQEVDHNELTKETVQELKKLGTVTIDGTSALIYAIKKLATKAVKLLCSYKILEGPDPLACAYDLVCAKETNVQATNLLEILIHSQAGTPENMQRLFEHLMQDERFDILDLIKDIPHFWFALLLDAVVQRKPNRVDEICKRRVFITNEQAAACIFKAVEVGSLDCVKTLLHYYPSSKNQQNSKGLSALHYAAQTEQAEIFTYLCTEIDITLEDAIGHTAGDLIAPNKPHSKIMQNAFNEALNQKKENDLHTKKMREYEQLKDLPAGLAAVKSDNRDAIEKLEADKVMWKNDKQQTLLMIAINEQKKRAIDALLARSEVEIHAQDDKGRTALFYAVETGDKTIVEKIMSKKVQILVSDKQGKTVFDIPCKDQSIKKVLKDTFIEQIDDSFMPHKVGECIKKINLQKFQKKALATHLCKKGAVQVLDELCGSDTEFLELVKKAVELHFTTLVDSPASTEIPQKDIPLDSMMALAFTEFVLKNNIASENWVLSAAIAASNKDVTEYILTHSKKQSWLAMTTSKMAKLKPFAEHKDLLKSLSCITFAGQLKRKDIIKILLKRPQSDLNIKCGMWPSWILLLDNFQDDPEIIELMRGQKIVADESLLFEQLLSSRFFFVVKFLLQQKIISPISTNITEEIALKIAKNIVASLEDKEIADIVELIKLEPRILNAIFIAEQAIILGKNNFFKVLYTSIPFTMEEKLDLLSIAFNADNKTVAEIILQDESIDINRINIGNKTPLMTSIALDMDPSLIEKLLNRPNVTLHTENFYRLNAIHMCRSLAIIDLLRKFDKSCSTFSRSLLSKSFDEIKKLMDRGNSHANKIKDRGALENDTQRNLNDVYEDKINLMQAQKSYNDAYYKAAFFENDNDTIDCTIAYLRANIACCLYSLGLKSNFADSTLSGYIDTAKKHLNVLKNSSETDAQEKCNHILVKLIELEKMKRLSQKNAASIKQEKSTLSSKILEDGVDCLAASNYADAWSNFKKAYYLANDQKTKAAAGVYLANQHIHGVKCPKDCITALFFLLKGLIPAQDWWASRFKCYQIPRERLEDKLAYYEASFILGVRFMDPKFVATQLDVAIAHLERVIASKEYEHLKAAAQLFLGYGYLQPTAFYHEGEAKKYLQMAANQNQDMQSKELAIKNLEEMER